MTLRFKCIAAAIVAAGFVSLASPAAAQASTEAAQPQVASDRGGRIMSQFLVHVHTGPSDPGACQSSCRAGFVTGLLSCAWWRWPPSGG